MSGHRPPSDLLEPVEASQLGYTLSIEEAIESSTLERVRLNRAITGANGPKLGAECPRLPARKVRNLGGPGKGGGGPKWMMRPAEFDAWFAQVAPTLPSDAIDSAAAIGIYAGRMLHANSSGYKCLHKRLADEAHDGYLTEYWILGQKRWSRAEVEERVALLASVGIGPEPIAQPDKSRRHVAGDAVSDTSQTARALGKRRPRHQPMSSRSVPALLARGALTAEKIGGRWWVPHEELETSDYTPRRPPRSKARVIRQCQALLSNGGRCPMPLEVSPSRAEEIDGGTRRLRCAECRRRGRYPPGGRWSIESRQRQGALKLEQWESGSPDDAWHRHWAKKMRSPSFIRRTLEARRLRPVAESKITAAAGRAMSRATLTSSRSQSARQTEGVFLQALAEGCSQMEASNRAHISPQRGGQIAQAHGVSRPRGRPQKM